MEIRKERDSIRIVLPKTSGRLVAKIRAIGKQSISRPTAGSNFVLDKRKSNRLGSLQKSLESML